MINDNNNDYNQNHNNNNDDKHLIAPCIKKIQCTLQSAKQSRNVTA